MTGALDLAERRARALDLAKKQNRYQVLREYRTVRRVLVTLPALEKDLLSELGTFGGIDQPISECPVERIHLLSSLRILRDNLRSAYRSLSRMRLAIDSTGISDDDLLGKMGDALNSSPYRDHIIKHFKYGVGVRAHLKRTSVYFRSKFDAYSECIDLVKSADDGDPLSKLTINVSDRIPGGAGAPGTVYMVTCFFHPPICAAILVFGLAYVLIRNGPSEDPEDDSGGVCEGEVEDPEENVCYGEEPPP